MPWTIEDVESHKKGLSDKKKKQWVRIANTALASCLKKGGTEEDCTAKAIKQANGVINTNATEAGTYALYVPTQDNYEVEIKLHEEKAYLVVPVVMMVEGVHHGSHGPLLHLIEDLGKFPEAWNGIPVVVNHPTKEGKGVSANSPEIIEQYRVGKTYNTFVDEDKLRSEIWFDEEKLNTLSPQIYAKINNNELVEVSVGVFTEEDDKEGEWQGETYVAIARNYRPDHLAVLPEDTGACSCKDGCGIRMNTKNEKNMEKKLEESIRKINLAGYSIMEIQANADQGFKETMEAIYGLLRSLETNNSYCYLEEVYEDAFIYSKSGSDGTQMYKQDYKYESGKIEMLGTPVEVRRKVEFVINTNLSRTKFKKEVNMATECAPCVKAKVDALIVNSKGRWTENDREFLETLKEDQLERMAPITVEVEKTVEVQVNAISEEDKQALATYRSEQKAKRDKMIVDIQANSSKELWPDATLKAMTDDTLKRVFDSVKKDDDVSDYSLNGGFQNNGASGEEEPLMVPIVQTSDK